VTTAADYLLGESLSRGTQPARKKRKRLSFISESEIIYHASPIYLCAGSRHTQGPFPRITSQTTVAFPQRKQERRKLIAEAEFISEGPASVPMSNPPPPPQKKKEPNTTLDNCYFFSSHFFVECMADSEPKTEISS
jgi:hypothetical protein